MDRKIAFLYNNTQMTAARQFIRAVIWPTDMAMHIVHDEIELFFMDKCKWKSDLTMRMNLIELTAEVQMA